MRTTDANKLVGIDSGPAAWINQQIGLLGCQNMRWHGRNKGGRRIGENRTWRRRKALRDEGLAGVMRVYKGKRNRDDNKERRMEIIKNWEIYELFHQQNFCSPPFPPSFLSVHCGSVFVRDDPTHTRQFPFLFWCLLNKDKLVELDEHSR